MAVLERSELEASPLADLHAIADQIGLDGFRRLRKAELIDAILGRSGGEDASAGEDGADEDGAGADRPPARRRRSTRTRRPRATSDEDEDERGNAAKRRRG